MVFFLSNYKIIFRIIIYAIITAFFLIISNAQEVQSYSIIFNPNEIYSKLGEEHKIDIHFAEDTKSNVISLGLVSGPGIEITSINAAVGSYISLNNNITNNIASIDIAKTSEGYFHKNEKVATLTFKITESINTLIEITPGSKVGDDEINIQSIQILAIDEAGHLIDSENIPETISTFSEVELPNNQLEDNIEDKQIDFFTQLGNNLNFDRNTTIILTISVVTLVIIVVLFFIHFTKKRVVNHP